MADQQNKISFAVRMGLLIGLISVGIHYLAALCLHSQRVVTWGALMGGLMAATTVLYGVTGIVYARNAGEAVTFRKIFKTIFIAILVSTVISFLWSILYMHFIGTDYAADYQQSRIAVLKMMHKTPAELGAEIKAMKEAGKSNISISAQFIFFGELILAKSIVAGIVTMLLLKTPKPSA